MKKAVFIAFILMKCFNCIGQNTFQFKGQIYHTRLGPQENISILIDNQYPAVTNDAGVFKVGLPNTTNHIKVSLSKSNYTILYPYGGFVLVPKDLNDVPQIIIGNASNNDYLQQYLALYKLVKNKPVGSDPGIIDLRRKMDSLQSALIKMHYTETELRTAKEIQDGKDDYLPEINGDIVDFRANAYDLKDAFKYIADYAFENGSALERLASSINNYNNSFNKLDHQHLNYEKRIADYWQSDSLRKVYHDLAGLALDTIHAKNIYPMQATISQIRDYFISRKKNTEAKKSIQQSISKMVQQLEILLTRLDEGTKRLAAALSV